MKMFISLLTSAIGFVLVWNLLAFLFCTFITGDAYTFTVGGSMIAPLTLTLIIQAVEMSTKKRERSRA